MKQIFWVLLALVVMSPPVTSQVTDEERIALERAQQYLRDIHRLVDAAEKSRQKEARFALDYEALRADLGTIEQALDRHLRAPQRSPRTLSPLLLTEAE